MIRLGAGVAAAALFAACAGGPGGAAGTATPTGPQLRPRPASPVRPPAGVLRIARVGRPGRTPEWDDDDRLLVYSRLVGLDPREPAIYGDLASGIEQRDPLSVRFTLRERVSFHPDEQDEMRPLTADHVRADLERRAAEGAPLFTDVVERVEAPDNRTVVLHLRAPFGLLFEMLAAPEASIRGGRNYKGSDIPVGSGPFVPVRRDADLLRYEANPARSAEDAPLLSAIEVVRASASHEADTAFATGEVDIRVHHVGLQAPPAAGAEAMLLTRPGRRLRGLGLSLLPTKDGLPVRHVEAFQDARVRRAVGLSLDGPAMRAFDGSFISGPVGPAHGGDALPREELDEQELYRTEPAAARSLLRAADAEDLAFTLTFPDQPAMLSMAQVALDNLHEAGFAPRLQSVPLADWQSAFLAGDFEATLFDLLLETPDVGLRLHTTSGVNGRFSLWGYSNPEYDAVVRDALSALDPVARAEHARAAQRALLADTPAMFPVGAAPEYALTADGVSGYQFDAYEFNSGYLASQWVAPAR
ncbi:MAG: ABC transporter substrate-binding protein [Dehalococcoidia bacterium]